MGTANRIAKNTGFLYIRMAITVFISLYSTRLILVALGVDDFGIFNVVAGSISMLMFLNNAMAGATQRFMSYSQGAGEMNRQKQIFNVSLVLHFSIALIIFVLLEVVGYFLFNGIFKITPDRINIAKLIYQFMVVSTLFTIISVPYDAIINAHENMLFFAVLGIIEAVVKLAIAFYISYASYDKLAMYGLLMAVLSFLMLILRQIYCHRNYIECRVNFGKYYNKLLFKEMTGFASWSFLGATTSMLGTYGQGIVLNTFFGTVVNAAQGVAGQISGQLGAFASTMLKALNPVIAKSEGAGNRSMMLRASMFGSKISFFLLIIFYVPVMIEMPYIFKLWLKNIPEYAVIFCRLILMRNLIEQFYATLSNSIAAVGDIKKYQIYSSLFYILPLIISYFLFVYHFQPFVLYLVFLFFACVSFGITVYFSHELCDLPVKMYMQSIVFRCLTSFIIIFLFSLTPLFFMNQGFMRLFLVTIISSMTYLIVGWLVGLTPEEREKARDVSKHLYSKSIFLFNKQR